MKKRLKKIFTFQFDYLQKKINDKEFKTEIELLTKHLKDSEKPKMQTVINKYHELFAQNPNKPGTQTKTKMHVQLKEGTKPIKLPPYRQNPTMAQEVKRQVDQLLEDDVIEKTTSPWSFPVVVVKKPDGSYRFCVDYSKLTENYKRHISTT